MFDLRATSALVLGLALLGSACGSLGDESTADAAATDTTSATTTTADESDTDDTTVAEAGITRDDLTRSEQIVLDRILDAVGERPDVWHAFSLAEIASVVPLLDENGEMTSGFVFFHPEPMAAGDAVPVLDVDPELALHYVPQVTDVPQPPKFSFEVDADVGGVETYVFPADSQIPLWSNVFVHEAFHVFQIRDWAGFGLDQSVYDFSPRNLELSLIENRALIAAYEADDLDETVESIRHFLAIRGTRLAEFDHVALDGMQENIEGTAEWFEWRHTGRSAVDKPYANPNTADISRPREFIETWATGFPGNAPLQRFYQTGATQLELLDRLDEGGDWQLRLEDGAVPSALLAEIVIVDAVEIPALVAEAQDRYDPTGNAAEIAAAWIAAIEGSAGEGDGHDHAETESWTEAPPEVLECVGAYGLTAEQLDADPTLITDEIAADCFGGVGGGTDMVDCLEAAGVDITADELILEDLSDEAIACLDG